MERCSVFSIDVEHQDEQQQIGDGLVELCRVARLCAHRCWVGIDKVEAPGHGGDIADDFRVHQVAQTDEAGGDACGNGNVVEHLPDGHLIAAHIKPQGEHQAQRAAMRSQALIARHLEVPVVVACELYGQQHLNEATHRGEIILGLVEDAVSQSCTHKDADKTVEEQRVELPVLYFLVFIQPAHCEVSQCQSDEPA